MSVHYAHCCNPIPGDSVLAYISQGKGLIIHIDTCKEFSKINVNKSKDYKCEMERFCKR